MPTQKEIEDYLIYSRPGIEEELLRKKTEREAKKKEDNKIATDIRKHRLAKAIPLEEYDEDYQMLDSCISDIEEDIATAGLLPEIAKKYRIGYAKFCRWLRCSREYNRIKDAFTFSAEYHVAEGFRVIREAIEDPLLTMQQAALIRGEMYNHNAVAAVRDRGVWGKKADENQSAQTVVIASDNQMQNMISELIKQKQITESSESEEFEEADEVDEPSGEINNIINSNKEKFSLDD